MGSRCLVAIAVGALFAGYLPADGADDKGGKELQGRWVSEKFVWAGRASEEGEKMIVVIGDDSVSWQYEKKVGNVSKVSENSYTYKLDTSQKPAAIDLTMTDGALKGQTLPCIYQLDGDTLKFCGNQAGQKRPTEFASKKGSDTMLVVLKRSK